jgi:DNA sulfur modification protein DndE
MPELGLRKIPFTGEAETRLRMLRARTGLDRNHLCRLGFCLSLEEPGIPRDKRPDEPSVREIDRYTLLGHHSQAYLALLTEWGHGASVDFTKPDTLDGAFVAHMNRGVELLASRVKTLGDVASLLRAQTTTHSNKTRKTAQTRRG